MPALIRFGGRLVARRLLDERDHPAVVVGGHHAEARRILDRRQVDRALGAASHGGSVTSAPTSRSVSTSPFTTTNVSSMPAVARGEADGAGGVERLGLDRVVQRARRRTCRRGRRRRTRRAGSRATAPPRRRRARPRWPTTRSIIGRWPTGSICFGVVSVSGRSRVPKPPTRTTALTNRWSPRRCSLTWLARRWPARCRPPRWCAGDDAGRHRGRSTSGVPGGWCRRRSSWARLVDARRLRGSRCRRARRRGDQHAGRCRSGSLSKSCVTIVGLSSRRSVCQTATFQRRRSCRCSRRRSCTVPTPSGSVELRRRSA